MNTYRRILLGMETLKYIFFAIILFVVGNYLTQGGLGKLFIILLLTASFSLVFLVAVRDTFKTQKREKIVERAIKDFIDEINVAENDIYPYVCSDFNYDEQTILLQKEGEHPIVGEIVLNEETWKVEKIIAKEIDKTFEVGIKLSMPFNEETLAADFQNIIESNLDGIMKLEDEGKEITLKNLGLESESTEKKEIAFAEYLKKTRSQDGNIEIEKVKSEKIDNVSYRLKKTQEWEHAFLSITDDKEEKQTELSTEDLEAMWEHRIPSLFSDSSKSSHQEDEQIGFFFSH